jgi:hypothetical protein
MNKCVNVKGKSRLGIVVHACNPIIQKTEEDGELKANLRYIVCPVSKTTPPPKQTNKTLRIAN